MTLRGTAGLFNDFYDYWAAARLLNQGRDPYDVQALVGIQHAAGLDVLAGGGYSYPLLFAELMRPLGLLPPSTAAFLFTCAGVIALGVAVMGLVRGMGEVSWLEVALAGLGGGLLEPVTGSLFFGQVNLLVLPLLVGAWRCRSPGALVAVASAVKLYPIAALMGLMTRGRRSEPQVLFSLALFGILVALPAALHPGAGFLPHSGSLLGVDPFWSNQSVTGFVSRLSLSSESARPPLPGLPVLPVAAIIDLLLLLAVAAVLWRAPGRPYAPSFALALWWGMAVAPRNSLWNFTPVLICFASAWVLSRAHPWRLLALLLAVGLIELQAEANVIRDWIYSGNPALSLVASSGLYGAIVVAAVLARGLLGGAQHRSLLHEDADHQIAVEPRDRTLPG